jgi:hypothetical protein
MYGNDNSERIHNTRFNQNSDRFRSSSLPFGQLGEDNLDIDTLNEASERLGRYSSSSSSNNSENDDSDTEGHPYQSLRTHPSSLPTSSLPTPSISTYQSPTSDQSQPKYPLRSMPRARKSCGNIRRSSPIDHQNDRPSSNVSSETIPPPYIAESITDSLSLETIPPSHIAESITDSLSLETIPPPHIAESITDSLSLETMRLSHIAESITDILSSETIDTSSTTRKSSRARKSPDWFMIDIRNTSENSDIMATPIVEDNNVVSQDISIQADHDDDDDDDDTTVETRERIVKSPDRNECTCLFYACYNSLRTQAERLAFSDGNLDHPSLGFVNMFLNDTTSETQRQRVENEGYTGEDMRLYLHSLRRVGIIKSYRWKPLKKWQLSNFFCSGNTTPITVVLFALSVVSTEKANARKKVKRAGDMEDIHPSRITHYQADAFIRFSLAYPKVVRKEYRHPHGGALQRDRDNKVYYYDSAKTFVLYEPTIVDISQHLTNISEAYEFFIVVNDENGWDE